LIDGDDARCRLGVLDPQALRIVIENKTPKKTRVLFDIHGIRFTSKRLITTTASR